MNREAFLSEIAIYMKRYEMLPEGAAVLCGFSGGADSVTLLSVLKEQDVPVYACHLNHGIRGAEAEHDEQFCETFCKERGIPLFVRRMDIPQLAREEGLSEETCGRNARYAFFEETAKQVLAEHPEYSRVRIATAHTASDNAETILFHLARGTGLSGLCGIPPVRGNIIRPLLACSREDIEEYCGESGLAYVTDSTNADTAYARNKIRLEVLPVLKDINPAAVSNMSRMAETLQRDRDHFAEAAQKLLAEALQQDGSYAASVLGTADDAVLVRAIAEICSAGSDVHPEQKHVEEILRWLRGGVTFGKLQLPGGAFAVCAGAVLRISPSGSTSKFLPEPDVCFTKYTRQEAESRSILLENCLDYDKIEPNFIVRFRAPGDVFAPPGRGVHKKLKTLFQEAGVPEAERAGRVVVESRGCIAFLEGFGASEEAKVTPETTTLIHVEVRR